MLKQLKRDAMLMAVAVSPFLIGAAFRFGIPLAERLLTSYFRETAILSPYYGLFDLFLIIITPSMLCFAVAMVMLEERDDHIAAYLAVTPLGKAGYMFSRLGLTCLISYIVSIIVAMLFSLSPIGVALSAGIALAGAIHGAVMALLIIAFSSNKVEGMAVGKLAGLLSLGALAPYFITGKAQYMLSFLPSFWMAKSMQSGSYPALAASILLALLWVALQSAIKNARIRL